MQFVSSSRTILRQFHFDSEWNFLCIKMLLHTLLHHIFFSPHNAFTLELVLSISMGRHVRIHIITVFIWLTTVLMRYLHFLSCTCSFFFLTILCSLTFFFFVFFLCFGYKLIVLQHPSWTKLNSEFIQPNDKAYKLTGTKSVAFEMNLQQILSVYSFNFKCDIVTNYRSVS